MSSFPTDYEIAQKANIKPIEEIAAKLNIPREDLEFYGKYKAKLPLNYKELPQKGKLILMTAMSPTKYGEGKTTMTIGLVDGLNKIGKQATAVLREPSLGPVFGVKGGAAGGGYVQVIPMEDINLHFTGDFSAVEKANNLLSAMIDNILHQRSHEVDLDPKTITWKRVMDMNDRALKQIIVGVGGKMNGVMREDGFNITPASEIMAILCLSENFTDLKRRLGNIYIGSTYDKKPVFARDINAVGSMAVLLRDALKPNLVQTIEGNPALIHGGPFASIAQGSNTIIATKTGLNLSDYVVTEAGFGADLGAEKFMHIKCVSGGIKPDAVVVVATIRALKYHGGASANDVMNGNCDYVELGFANLQKHCENMKKFGFDPIVVINSFPTDSPEAHKLVVSLCERIGVKAEVSFAFQKGGEGSVELAKAVVKAIESKDVNFTPLYNRQQSIEQKIAIIAKEIYGADNVSYTTKAKTQIKQIEKLGFGGMAICMAKTPMSFSDDEKKIGRPENFTIQVREFEYATGAEFIIPILGDIMRMPGLPQVPNAVNIDIDENCIITGIF